jgi:hypothetical protein
MAKKAAVRSVPALTVGITNKVKYSWLHQVHEEEELRDIRGSSLYQRIKAQAKYIATAQIWLHFGYSSFQ